jgi:hypothetical protein
VAALTGWLIVFTGLYTAPLYLLGLLAVLLAASQCGASVSLDARRFGAQERVPGAAVTLIRVQISVVYLFAAIAKLNWDFLSGNVVFLGARGSVLAPDLDSVAHPALFATLAVATIALELFIAGGLWVRAARPAVFAAGLAMHIGMVLMLGRAATLAGLAVFALLMLSSYLLFLDLPARRHLVLWDEGSGAVSALVRWLRRLDWLHVHDFAGSRPGDHWPDRIAPGQPRGILPLRLVDGEGHTHVGFEALRRILGLLPLTFLWAPGLALRPVNAAGRRLWGPVGGGLRGPVHQAHSGT